MKVVYIENQLARQTIGMMTGVKLIHEGSVLSTSPALSLMTCVDIMAYISYMYQVEPVHVSGVGPMPVFIF